MTLIPAEAPQSRTFGLTVTPSWRSVEIEFEPGAYSADFVASLGLDPEGRTSCSEILEACTSMGAIIDLSVNGVRIDAGAPLPNETPWKSFALRVRKGQLPLDIESIADSESAIVRWASKSVAALISLLPLDADVHEADPGALGLAEGAVTRIEVNRYERDRRNRAAALAIHGFNCKACDTNLEEVYGEAATDFIEVHHVTPISEIGSGYRINPRTDLVPLCPNCHGVIHRRTPPWTVAEIREMLKKPAIS